MARINTHKIEEKSINLFKSLIDESEFADLILVREFTGRDYGYDLLIELFDNEEPTGKICLIQLKGTNEKIESLKKKGVVACPNVSKSSLRYVKQTRVPFILIYLSLKTKSFYYLNLTEIKEIINNLLNENQKSYVIHIPIDNNTEDGFDKFMNMINDYYN